MKWDRMDHPASHRAASVAAVCLLGYVVLWVVTIVAKRPEPAAIWLADATLTIVFISSLVTYFRPRGLPAAITATASLALYALAAILAAGAALRRYAGLPAPIPVAAAAIVVVIWIGKGIRDTRREFRRDEKPGT